MAFGRPRGAATADALFSLAFLVAALFNIGPALVVEPSRAELVFIGGAHALFMLRVIVAREAARRQRAIDLARFTGDPPRSGRVTVTDSAPLRRPTWRVSVSATFETPDEKSVTPPMVFASGPGSPVNVKATRTDGSLICTVRSGP